ncbi:MAG: response regulator [Planctomycetes bacterium]|nr:response regulator [Planctomycetota bacterium]
MQLRGKTGTIVLGTFAVYLVVIGLVLRFGVYPYFEELERQEAERNAIRVAEAVQAKCDDQLRFTVDYAWWDDTYNYMETLDPEYIKVGITLETFETRGLNFLYICREDNTAVFSYCSTEGNSTPDPEPLYTDAQWKQSGPLNLVPDASKGVAGLVITPKGPAIVAFADILPGERNKPTRGKFLFGKFVDAKYIEALKDQTRLEFRLLPAEGPEASRAPVAAALARPESTQFEVENSETLDTFRAINDIAGKPLLVIEVEHARTITNGARRMLWLTMGLLTLAGLLVAGATMFVLQKQVIRRMAGMGRDLLRIRKQEGAADKLPLEGADELTDLARQVNETMDALRALERAREQARMEKEVLEGRVAERTRELSEANTRLQAEMEARQRAHDELRRMDEALRESQKMDAVGRLAAGIAHDFNNMLMGMRGWAEVLGMRLEGKPQEAEMAQRIVKSADSCAELVSQLLAFSRRGKMQAVAVDMHEVANDVAKLLEHAIDPRIRLAVHASAPRHDVKGDPTQLRNAVLNLGVNARDAMPEGGELTISTAISRLKTGQFTARGFDTPDGEYIKITVSDTGTGMDQETVSHLFEPFFTRKGLGKGTGLGLAAVYGTVRNHGGAIEVETELGRGSRFHVYLPLLASPAEQARQAESAPVPGKGTVLFVDDEPFVRDLASHMLTQLGYKVLVAESGRVAVDIYRRDGERIDVVMLDMMMPGLNGVDTLRELVALDPSVRVLFESGGTLDRGMEGLDSPNVAGFLHKPFSGTQLSKAVAGVLQAAGA